MCWAARSRALGSVARPCACFICRTIFADQMLEMIRGGVRGAQYRRSRAVFDRCRPGDRSPMRRPGSNAMFARCLASERKVTRLPLPPGVERGCFVAAHHRRTRLDPLI